MPIASLQTRSLRRLDWLVTVAGLGMLSGCNLTEPDVVTRAPASDARGNDPNRRDASDGGATTADDAKSESSVPDAPSFPTEVRESDLALSTSTGKDGMDGPAIAIGDTAKTGEDGHLAGEVGPACSDLGSLFCDGFDNGPSAWLSANGTWVTTQEETSPESNAVFESMSPGTSSAYIVSGAWQDVTVEVRVKVTSFGQPSSSNRAEVYARFQDTGNFYAVSLRGDGMLGLRRSASGFGTPVSVGIREKEWHTLKIRVSGPADAVVVEGFLDSTLIATAPDTDGTLVSAVGSAGVGVYGGTQAVFDDVKVSSP
jgi:hypothetical protein